MALFTKDTFPEIRSEPNWFWTWCIRILFLVIFGPLIILLYTIPLAFYMDGSMDASGLSAFGLIYYPFLIWMSYLAIRYMRRIKGNAIKYIRVNRNGVFYKRINGTEEMLLYEQLDIGPAYIVHDVFPKTGFRYSPTVLKVFLNGAERIVQFHTDAAYSYYSGNRRLLRSHFIRGVALFRPELRIAPSVYSEFFIDPETYRFDKKAYWKTIVAVIILISIIVVSIVCYTKYRFGNALFF